MQQREPRIERERDRQRRERERLGNGGEPSGDRDLVDRLAELASAGRTEVAAASY